MGFRLDDIVPWGRSYDEYLRMFDLKPDDLGRRIIGCGDGPAAFNGVMTAQGGRVVSFDPLYGFDAARIRGRIAETRDAVLEQLRLNRDDYLWNEVRSVEELGSLRMSAMEVFLDDYEAGRAAGRYVAGSLPSLPFPDGSFDLALSSHFLFLYSATLSLEFHLQSLKEMLRVAREVRIFPLLSLDGSASPLVPQVVAHFTGCGYLVETPEVYYEFQRGGNMMMVVKPA